MSDWAEGSAAWDSVAAGWGRRREDVERNFSPIRERMLELAAIRPGDTILDVGAGAGALGFAALEQVPGARLISTDFSPRMVEQAQTFARSTGIDNAEFAVMDATALDLGDDSVDVALCRFALMLVPDAQKAASEVRRVLRDGRFIVATWAGPEHNPWIVTIGMAMLQTGIAPPGDLFAPGGLFSLAQPAQLAGVLQAGGFADVDVEEIDASAEFSDFSEYWDVQTDLAGPLSAFLQQAPPETVRDIRTAAEELTASYGSDGKLAFPGRANVAVAR